MQKAQMFLVVAFFLMGPSPELKAAGHISGTVTVAAKLKTKVSPSDILFVYARKLGVQGGPPVAVLRLVNPSFPQKFELGPENSMIQGTPFQGPFQIQAKLSKSGSVGTSKGDLTGKLAPAKGVAETASGITVELIEEAP